MNHATNHRHLDYPYHVLIVSTIILFHMAKALLITGATGKQGGSVLNALLRVNADFEILALTRNTQSPSAQKLVQKSPKIKLVAGDLDAADDIFRKAKEISKLPIWGVYSVQVGSWHVRLRAPANSSSSRQLLVMERASKAKKGKVKP